MSQAYRSGVTSFDLLTLLSIRGRANGQWCAHSESTFCETYHFGCRSP